MTIGASTWGLKH